MQLAHKIELLPTSFLQTLQGDTAIYPSLSLVLMHHSTVT